ncbi:MAG: hypothetical protein WDN48_09935 [Pseudolabrys sp.]
MLKVTVAEVRRDVIKQLGIDLSGSFNYGTAVVNFNQVNPFSANGQTLSTSQLAGSMNGNQRHAACHGPRRHPAHAGRTELDGDFRRNSELRCRR